ncbi:TlpA disulfide reductase family protein, partial [Rhizobium johnstonii]|uniref:TlpA disulfide reductase family protein n=1 Tax=Rhizobium johnstonii TaxID=3019933 RepID=UPI003F973963
ISARKFFGFSSSPLSIFTVTTWNLSLPISFNGPDGKPLTLDHFAGKTVLLNLWAKWCVPCREEMPALNALEKEMGSDRFQVVPVNIDSGDDE